MLPVKQKRSRRLSAIGACVLPRVAQNGAVQITPVGANELLWHDSARAAVVSVLATDIPDQSCLQTMQQAIPSLIAANVGALLQYMHRQCTDNKVRCDDGSAVCTPRAEGNWERGCTDTCQGLPSLCGPVDRSKAHALDNEPSAALAQDQQTKTYGCSAWTVRAAQHSQCAARRRKLDSNSAVTAKELEPVM